MLMIVVFFCSTRNPLIYPRSNFFPFVDSQNMIKQVALAYFAWWRPLRSSPCLLQACETCLQILRPHPHDPHGPLAIAVHVCLHHLHKIDNVAIDFRILAIGFPSSGTTVSTPIPCTLRHDQCGTARSRGGETSLPV